MEMSRLTRDGTAKTISRDQNLRRERGQGNIDFPRTADHVQDWQPYPGLIHTLAVYVTIHTYYIHVGGPVRETRFELTRSGPPCRG